MVPATAISTLTINRQALALRLRDARLLQGSTEEEVSARLEKVMKGYHFRKRPDTDKVDELVRKGAAALEAGGPGELQLSIDSLEVISSAYKVHRLLLDPLGSKVVRVTCIVQSVNDFFEVSQCDNATSYGTNARYRVPTTRLAATSNTALVWLSLYDNGNSDSHSHRGDELMLVLKGTIELRLDTSGMWTRLSEGDYSHFYSEQTHSAWSLADANGPAEVFIIRFHPSDASGSRHSLAASIRKDLSKWPTYLKSRVANEIQEIVALQSSDIAKERSRLHADEPMCDRYGLGRFLQLLASEKFRGSSNALSLAAIDKLAKERGTENLGRSRVDRMYHGQSPVLAREIADIAKLYDVEPYLLLDYLFPAHRPAIAVRGGAAPGGAHSDWSALPEEYSKGMNVKYFVPIRRLADSDTSIALVELPPGASTPDNRHPGHELLIPLEGKVRIRFGQGDGYELCKGRDRFAHFDSDIQHRVENCTSEIARIAVIRLYE